MLRKHLQAILTLALLMSFTQCAMHEPSIKDIEGAPTMAASVREAHMVPWCDLIRSPASYDKKVVRTRALLHVDHENQFLYNPDCERESASPVWADFDPSYAYSDESLKRRLTDLVRPKVSAPAGTAWVTVVGLFDGPGGEPYGHLDGYRSRVLIMRLERVEEADLVAKTPNE